MLKNLRAYFSIRRSGLFVAKYYLQNNPDVRKADVDPLLHFIKIGWKEGRNPGPFFDVKYYLENNIDVQNAGVNPVMHYLRFGWKEGRSSKKYSDSELNYSINKKNIHIIPKLPRILVLINLLHKVRKTYRNDGIRITLLKIKGGYKSKANPLLGFLQIKFPDKFIASSNERLDNKPNTILDYSAIRSLSRIISLLGLSVDSGNMIHQLKESFGLEKYYKMLDDLFTLENYIFNPRLDSSVCPLLQVSKLPEISLKPRRKSILFITSQFPNPTNGGGNRVLNFIKILSQNNEIYLSTCFIPDEDGSELINVKPYCKSIQNIPYWKFGNNQEEIMEWLNGKKMDIIHYEWPQSIKNYDQSYGQIHIFTYMEAISLRLKMDIVLAEPLSNKGLKIFPELLHFLRLELVDTSKFDSRIAVTTKDAAFFQTLYPHQEYAVLNHGINLDEFSLPNIEPDPNTLVFVGNFRHYPNVDAMLFFFNTIWDGIQKEIPDVRIYLVGANPPEELTLLADGQQIIVTGSVPDVRLYIQKASICIAPLITGAGLRGKVVEYAGLRRTFVATSIATTDLVYKDGIDYLCADTAIDFTEKIIDLLKDTNLRKRMSSSAFETTRLNYDTHHLAGYLVRLYEHLEFQKQQENLLAQLEPKLETPISNPMNVSTWLSYFEKRIENPPWSEKNMDLSVWPKVSILILTYNNLQFNQLCLRSVYCNTTYPNFEVIVVDNASTDGTQGWLTIYAKTHSNLRLILNKDNRGFAGGNNQAAFLSTGEFLIFLNNDTVVTNGWVKRLLAHIQSDPKIGLVGPVTNSTGNEARISINYRSASEMEAFSDWRAKYFAGKNFDIRMLAFYCVMARKDQYNTLGGLDERFLVGMFEDDDLAVRYHLQDLRVVCAEDVFIHHFQGASFGKLEINKYNNLFEENKRKYEEKWGRKWEPYKSR